MRGIALAVCLVIVLASCSSEPTLTEYAAEVERVTNELTGRIDFLSADVAARFPPPAAPKAEDIQVLYREIATAYRNMRDGIQELDPPREVAELHAESLEIAERLTAASDTLAERALDFDDDNLDRLWATPEFQAADAAQNDIITFCQNAQARFDATADREAFADVPWISTEMQEVVLVAFGCDRYQTSDSD